MNMEGGSKATPSPCMAAAQVLRRVDQGLERLDRRIEFGRKALLPGASVTEKRVGGAGMGVTEQCHAAITVSDNAAANLLLRSFGGSEGRPAWPGNWATRSPALVSATSTSPLGSISNQRGWSRPLAKAATRVPSAAWGVAPAGQPRAGAMLTVGISVGWGATQRGLGPVPSATVSKAVSPQAASKRLAALSRARRARVGHVRVQFGIG